MLYVYYHTVNKNNRIKSILWGTTTPVGGYDQMTTLQFPTFGDHTCETKPASGNHEIWVPWGYLFYSGKDYCAVFSTGLESGGKCTNQFGKYYLFVSTYATLAGQFTGYLTSSQGVSPAGKAAFFDPNSLGLGLAAFSAGLTPCEDVKYPVNCPANVA